MLETKAAIEAATLKLTQLTTELEPKKKMATDLEKQKTDSQAAMDNAAQSLAATEETFKAAQVRLDSRKQLVTKESEELASVKTKSESLKAQSEMVTFSAHAIAFADANTIAAVRNSASQNTDKSSVIDLFSAETLERIDTQSVSYSIHSNAALMAPISDPTVQGNWQQERLIDSAKIIVDRVTALAFSPDGSKLAMGSGLSSRTGQLAIVNVNDGSPIALPSDSASTALGDTLDLHSDTILGLSYSPDGLWLASCGADKMTKLLDTSTNKVVKIFEGHTHHVLALAWQDSGHQLATASADSTVKIWNIERGESVRTVTGFGTEVTALSFIGTTENMVSSRKKR
jgi:WD40 repeat protein